MTIQALRKLILTYHDQASSSCKIQKRALVEILNSCTSIQNYLSEADMINQAAAICEKNWNICKNITKGKQYDIQLSVIPLVLSPMKTLNEIDIIFADSNFDNMYDFKKAIKDTALESQIPYSVAEDFLQMRDL